MLLYGKMKQMQLSTAKTYIIFLYFSFCSPLILIMLGMPAASMGSTQTHHLG